MGVNLQIITDHALDLGQPEKIIDFFENQIDTGHLHQFYQKLMEINAIQELPPRDDAYRIYFNQEKYGSWVDALIETKQLGFESALTDIRISRERILIDYGVRFMAFANQEIAFTLMQYVFDLISQLGGREAIFMPDGLPVAHVLLGAVRHPVINQQVPEKPQWDVCRDLYNEKIYKPGILFSDIKEALHTMYGEPSF